MNIEQNKKEIAEDYPWLLKFMPRDAQEFLVETIDLDTLDLCVAADDYSLVEILVFDNKGTLVGFVGKRMVEGARILFSSALPFFKMVPVKKVKTFSELNVGAALKRFGPEARNVRFIVVASSFQVTVHKLPNRVASLADYLKGMADRRDTASVNQRAWENHR